MSEATPEIVYTLAQGFWSSRDQNEMNILGDALEEIGDCRASVVRNHAFCCCGGRCILMMILRHKIYPLTYPLPITGVTWIDMCWGGVKESVGWSSTLNKLEAQNLLTQSFNVNPLNIGDGLRQVLIEKFTIEIPGVM